jgi:parallel beta-helix repeat protein
MHKPLKSTATVLSLVAWFVILMHGAAAQGPSNVIKVPEDFPTIQEAVNNALPGQLILVQGGTYDEIVTVQKANLDIRGIDGAELTGTFDIQADGVTVAGFHITTQYHNQGIQTRPVSNVTIKNNVIIRDPANDFAWRAIWLFECQNCSVKNNTLLSHELEGISLVGNVTGTEVKNNIADANGVYGIFLWPGSSNAIVTNNSAHDNGTCDIVNMGTGHVFKNNRADCTQGF